jgi:Trk-type K+ transport system membrane component
MKPSDWEKLVQQETEDDAKIRRWVKLIWHLAGALAFIILLSFAVHVWEWALK